MEALLIIFGSLWFLISSIVAIRGLYVRNGLCLTRSDGYSKTYYVDRHGNNLYRDKPSDEDYAYEQIRGAKLFVKAPIWPWYMFKWLFLGLVDAGRGLVLTLKDATKELEK